MADKKSKQILRKQPINRKVVLALVPCIMGGIYFFGWRSLAMVMVAAATGFLTEFILAKKLRNDPATEAVFVTTTIFALIMPPTVPWHVLIFGVIFAIFFSKEVFGGFGRNIFNPAMAGRCFVYICFPVALTGVWSPPAQGPMGALTQWSTMYADDGALAVTGASPMGNLKLGKLELTTEGSEVTSETVPFDIPEGESEKIQRVTLLKNLAFGRIPGTMGVTSVILILIGGTYLFVTKTASRISILTVIITYAVLNQVLYMFGVDPVPGALPAVMGGGFLFGAFFMVTDPVSSPRTNEAKFFYAMIIAISTTVIRNFSIFNGGLMFSVLIGNMFAPILDYAVRSYKSGKKAKAAKGGDE